MILMLMIEMEMISVIVPPKHIIKINFTIIQNNIEYFSYDINSGDGDIDFPQFPWRFIVQKTFHYLFLC